METVSTVVGDRGGCEKQHYLYAANSLLIRFVFAGCEFETDAWNVFHAHNTATENISVIVNIAVVFIFYQLEVLWDML